MQSRGWDWALDDITQSLGDTSCVVLSSLQVALDYGKAVGIVKSHDRVVIFQKSGDSSLVKIIELEWTWLYQGLLGGMCLTSLASIFDRTAPFQADAKSITCMEHIQHPWVRFGIGFVCDHGCFCCGSTCLLQTWKHFYAQSKEGWMNMWIGDMLATGAQ